MTAFRQKRPVVLRGNSHLTCKRQKTCHSVTEDRFEVLRLVREDLSTRQSGITQEQAVLL